MSKLVYTLVTRSRAIKFSNTVDRAFSYLTDEIDDLYSRQKCSKVQLTEYMHSGYYISHCASDYDFDPISNHKDWLRCIELDVLSYNEALCILLGFNVENADEIITIDLSLYDNKSELDACYTDIVFFESPENNFLRRKFHHNSINTEEFLSWATDKKFIEKVVIKSSGRHQRKVTTELQQTINSIARTVMQKYPSTPKYLLAEDVQSILKKDHEIDRKSSTIRTEYLKKHPNY